MVSNDDEMRMAKILFGEDPGDELDKLNLTKKTHNCLVRAGITTLIEVFELNEKRLSAIPHMNKTMAEEVVKKVSEFLSKNVHEIFANSKATFDDDFE